MPTSSRAKESIWPPIFSLFSLFAFPIRITELGPVQTGRPPPGKGAGGLGASFASSIQGRNPAMGPESLRTGTRPVPQYGTRIRDRGPARPAIAIWKSEMCALGRRVLINAQIAVPFVGPHRVCPKNDISETPASKKCSLTVGQSNFETDQMKTVVISGFLGVLIFCALIILVWAALGLTSA